MSHTRPTASIPPAANAGLAACSLIGACIGMLLSPSSMLLISFGLYVAPIIADTGWSRTVVAGAIGPNMVIVGLLSPAVGWAANRLGPKRFVSCAFPLFGVALMLLASATSATMFALLLALAGALMSGHTMIPYAYCVSGWFEARRGLALGVMLAFTGVGFAVVPPVVSRLLEWLGWRGTFVAMGLFVCVAGVLVARLLIFDAPAATPANRAQVPGVPWQKALRMPVFWLLGVSISLLGCAASGGMVNLYELLTERGVPRQSASFIMGVVGLSMICARLGFGYLFDRVSAHRVMVFICALLGAAFIVLAATGSPAGVVVAAVLIGIGFGSEGDALSYMTSRLFGMRDFAKIFGLMFMAFTFGGGAGPVLFAVLKGRSGGSHDTALWASIAICVVAAGLASLIRQRDLAFARHSPPVRTEGRPHVAVREGGLA